MKMTKAQIARAVFLRGEVETALRILTLDKRVPESMTYNQAIAGLINDPDYDAYMYLWRNLAYRFSHVAEQYELRYRT